MVPVPAAARRELKQAVKRVYREAGFTVETDGIFVRPSGADLVTVVELMTERDFRWNLPLVTLDVAAVHEALGFTASDHPYFTRCAEVTLPRGGQVTEPADRPLTSPSADDPAGSARAHVQRVLELAEQWVREVDHPAGLVHYLETTYASLSSPGNQRPWQACSWATALYLAGDEPAARRRFESWRSDYTRTVRDDERLWVDRTEAWRRG